MKESVRNTFLCVLIGVVIVLALVVIPRLKEQEEYVDLSEISDSLDTSETTSEDITPEPSPAPLFETEEQEEKDYHFRNNNLLMNHFDKHGIEMGFDTAAEYETAASAVVNNPAALHKTEKEDGDDVYYLEDTNEFVIVSQDGYIRTYFNPSDGINYYNRQ